MDISLLQSDASADGRTPIHADDRPHARDKSIDGWRAIAASMVVFAHGINYRFAHIPGPIAVLLRRISGPLAELGVQLFFVISGYIITSLLLRERAQRGTVSIAAFYARRTTRIMPPLVAYYLCLIALDAADMIVLPGSSLLSSATFTCNTGIVDCDWWVAHTWSLAVEEQFYLVWPLLFGAIAPFARPPLLASALAICTIGAIVQPPTFHSNFTSFACIAMGTLYAVSPRVRQLLAAQTHWLAWAVAGVLVTVVPLTRLAPLVTPALPLLVCYIIFVGNRLRWTRAALQHPLVQIVGLGSYSLYLWQQLFLANPAHYAGEPPSLLLLPIAVIASVYLVEKPFMRIGRRLSRRVERPVVG